MHKDTISFNIKEVAKQIDVSSATIRNWEKSNLFVAKRNINNYRIYSMDDMEILKKIRYLSIEKKMNSFSIKKMIDQDSSLAIPDIFHPSKMPKDTHLSKRLLSQKWRQLREDKKLTLEEVSKATGISVSYLSKIENGNANLSLDMLKKLSEYYGESLLYFYEEASVDKLKITESEREVLDIGIEGVYIESLVQRTNTTLRPTIFTVLPNAGQSKSHSHRGEEFIYVLKGTITFTLNEEDVYELSQGDSLSFPSSTTHKWKNQTDRKAEMLWVHTPIDSNILD